MGSKKVIGLLHLYTDALAALRAREMVDPTKTALFGASYGASLALVLAAQDTKVAALVLAYPYPVSPPDLSKLVTAPILFIGGSRDRPAQNAKAQLVAAGRAPTATLELFEPSGVRHGFLARDLSAYDLPQAEAAWTRVLAFVKQRLLPAPPKPPTIPGVKPSGPTAASPATPKAPAAPATSTPVAPRPASPPPAAANPTPTPASS